MLQLFTLAANPVQQAARGRGLGGLIRLIRDGGPVAWTIVGVIVAGVIGFYGFKAYKARQG